MKDGAAAGAGGAGARADIWRDHGARREVVEHVRHGRSLVDLAGLERERAVGIADHAGPVVLAIDAFQLDARADEVVADLAARSPAGVHRIAVIVEQPVQSALCADIESRIGRTRSEQRLRAGNHGEGSERDSAQHDIFHRQYFLTRATQQSQRLLPTAPAGGPLPGPSIAARIGRQAATGSAFGPATQNPPCRHPPWGQFW